LAKARYEPDPELKEKKMTAFKEELTPYYLTKFEGIIKDNGGYIANGKVLIEQCKVLIFIRYCCESLIKLSSNFQLSWGDFYVASVLELMSCLDCVDLDNYPNCKALKQTVMDLPKVKAWIEKRPKTDF
jgi:glutathione S-transferase